MVRAERREKAINRVTVRRYMIGWLGVESERERERERFRGGFRGRMWRRMRGAAGWVCGEGRRVLGDGDVSGSGSESESEQVNREAEALSNLVDAIITLFGVQNTWAYLGPHRSACRPSGEGSSAQDEEPKPAEFWCLVAAAYLGNIKMVRYLLEDVEKSSAGMEGENPGEKPLSRDEKIATQSDWLMGWPKSPGWTLSVYSVAAALTVAIRRGHRDMVTMLLGTGLMRATCCSVRFWNDRTVLGTCFAVTADQNPEVAELAVETIKRFLGEWLDGLWMTKFRWNVEHLRHALDIPTSSGILRDVIASLLPDLSNPLWEDEIVDRVLFLLLCQAALTNDVERAEQAVEAIFVCRVKRMRTANYTDSYLMNPHHMKDEFGVRPNRLMDAMNPIQIAALLSHYEILEWLLGKGWEIQRKIKPWQVRSTSSFKYYVLKDLAKNARENDPMLDARQEAVYHAFIDRGRLPACIQPASDPKILELILRNSTDLSWEHETIISAGTRNVDIFETFVNFVNLNKHVPQKIDRQKGRLFVQGAHARTVGERSLQHALKAGRFDNAKVLLMRGVKLAEAIRSDGFYHDDPKAMAILKGLQEMELPGLSVVSRTMQVLYWVNGDVRLRLSQTKTIEENEKGYVWKHGQKLKRIGAPTFPALKSPRPRSYSS